jgi:hypothetical protein
MQMTAGRMQRRTVVVRICRLAGHAACAVVGYKLVGTCRAGHHLRNSVARELLPSTILLHPAALAVRELSAQFYCHALPSRRLQVAAALQPQPAMLRVPAGDLLDVFPCIYCYLIIEHHVLGYML